MEKQIYAYALIKSQYDNKGDFLDSFYPFILSAFPRKMDLVKLNDIQKELKLKINFIIPQHTIRTILNIAIGKGYIEKRELDKKYEYEYKLTNSGETYLDKLETEFEVSRRINYMLNDLKEYFKEKADISLSINKVQTILLSFLIKNLEPLIEYINPEKDKGEYECKKGVISEKDFFNYIEYVENQRPDIYKTLQDIVLGSILSTILKLDDYSQINKKFKKCQIYFDTNFIFSLLNLHHDVYNKPAKELFNLITKYNFELKIFDFTITEICGVINGYIEEGKDYPNSFGVDSMYSKLKMLGWKKSDVKEFIVDIENKLYEFGISIEWTDIDLTDYEPLDIDDRKKMERYKPLQGKRNQNHDLAAVEFIKNIRGHPLRKLEESKAFFLSSDFCLSKYNYKELNHSIDGTVCEVILDRLLTNILWLKNPSTEISLKSIISVHSRDLLVNKRIWKRFHKIVKALKNEGKINDEKTSMLFYHGYIGNVLQEFDESDANKISEVFILDEIENATNFQKEDFEKLKKNIENEMIKKYTKEKKSIKYEFEKNLESKTKEIEVRIKKENEVREKEFIENLEKRFSLEEKRKNEKWLIKIQQNKKNIKDESKNLAKNWILGIQISIGLIIFASIILIGYDLKIIGGIALFISITTIIGISIKTKWENFENYIKNKIYFKRLSYAKLDKLEEDLLKNIKLKEIDD